MMKKAIVCALLALALALPDWQGFFERTAQEPVMPHETPKDTAFEVQLGTKNNSTVLDVALYYRFTDSGLLGMQRAELDLRQEQTVASSMVQMLVNGPDAAHDRLVGVFPQGTRVIAAEGDGTTAFVTLSRGFLGRPNSAPRDWEDSTYWQEEAALRRTLAVQSIVLSLTEGARYQRVQLFVADNDDSVPERIPMAYFDPSVSDMTLMLGACGRDETLLLTPQRTMERVLTGWRKQQWDTVYPLLARTAGEEVPSLSAFEARMQKTEVSLLSFTCSGGTTSADGQSATVVVEAQIHSADGGDARIERESVRLVRDADNWAVLPTALDALMIRD